MKIDPGRENINRDEGEELCERKISNPEVPRFIILENSFVYKEFI